MTFGEFTTYDGHKIKIYPSSNAELGMIWLKVTHRNFDGEEEVSIEMTKTDIKILMGLLEKGMYYVE